MKKIILAVVFTAILPAFASATPIDTIGGPDGTTTTINHCGYLPSSAKLYTSSEVTNRIIERKLITLGYAQAIEDGKFRKGDRRAVKKFQADYGLTTDGVVGPLTAQRLAFATHPNKHVRDCSGLSRI